MKKTLALLLALVLVIAMFPLSASAAVTSAELVFDNSASSPPAYAFEDLGSSIDDVSDLDTAYQASASVLATTSEDILLLTGGDFSLDGYSGEFATMTLVFEDVNITLDLENGAVDIDFDFFLLGTSTITVTAPTATTANAFSVLSTVTYIGPSAAAQFTPDAGAVAKIGQTWPATVDPSVEAADAVALQTSVNTGLLSSTTPNAAVTLVSGNFVANTDAMGSSDYNVTGGDTLTIAGGSLTVTSDGSVPAGIGAGPSSTITVASGASLIASDVNVYGGTVTNSGTIVADDDVNITSSGKLTNSTGGLVTATNVVSTDGTITNSGTIYADSDFAVTNTDVENTGTINAEFFDVYTGSDVTNDGTVATYELLIQGTGAVFTNNGAVVDLDDSNNVFPLYVEDGGKLVIDSGSTFPISKADLAGMTFTGIVTDNRSAQQQSTPPTTVSPWYPTHYGAFSAKNGFEVVDGDEGTSGQNIGGGGTGTATTGSYRVLASRLNYRSGPGMGYPIVGQINMNTVIQATGIVDGWVAWKTADGQTVYSSLAYLVPISQATDVVGRTMITTANLNMRTGPGMSYGIITTAPAGSVIDVIGYDGSWVQVNYLGQTGYMSIAYLR